MNKIIKHKDNLSSLKRLLDGLDSGDNLCEITEKDWQFKEKLQEFLNKTLTN